MPAKHVRSFMPAQRRTVFESVQIFTTKQIKAFREDFVGNLTECFPEQVFRYSCLSEQRNETHDGNDNECNNIDYIQRVFEFHRLRFRRNVRYGRPLVAGQRREFLFG